MEHVVFFPAPDGAPVFRRVSSLEEAVRLVERLRNVEGVAEVAVHPLGAEVPLAFRAWYRVEVPGSVPVDAAPVEALPADEVPVDEAVVADVPPVEAVAEAPVEAVVPYQPEPAVEPVLAEPEPAAASNGHASEGVPSLGFFA